MIHLVLLAKQYWVAVAWLAGSAVTIGTVSAVDGNTSFDKADPNGVGSIVIEVPGPTQTAPGPLVTVPGPIVIVPGPTVTAPPVTVTPGVPPTPAPTVGPSALPSPTPTTSEPPPPAASTTPAPTPTPKNKANGRDLFCLKIADHGILIKVPCRDD